jgi:hypothetical protein
MCDQSWKIKSDKSWVLGCSLNSKAGWLCIKEEKEKVLVETLGQCEEVFFFFPLERELSTITYLFNFHKLTHLYTFLGIHYVTKPWIFTRRWWLMPVILTT